MKRFGILLLLILSTFSYGQTSFNQENIEAKLDSFAREISKLKKELRGLKEDKAGQELENLRKAATEEAKTPTEEKKLDKKTFREGSRSLQALNPEISVTSDFFGNYQVESPHYTGDLRSGFHLRVAEFLFQANLDPYSFTKVIFEAGAEGFGLGEAYITWINLFSRVNFTVGKFRQQFGVVNRWHQHALDQLFFPLPISLYMGEEGLNQVGFSLNWLLPSLIASANELILQVTNSQNEALFSGDQFSLPSTLLRFKNFYDIDPSTYFEWGLSGIAGTNDTLGFTFSEKHTWTYMAGLDLTFLWEPVARARFRSLTWRTELFYLYREQKEDPFVKAVGAYSYMQYRFSRRFIGGVRFDIAQPPVSDNGDMYLWQIVPYITFWQSEFVYLRLEWDHLEGKNMDVKNNQIYLQVDWAIGPHKHEKY